MAYFQIKNNYFLQIQKIKLIADDLKLPILLFRRSPRQISESCGHTLSAIFKTPTPCDIINDGAGSVRRIGPATRWRSSRCRCLQRFILLVSPYKLDLRQLTLSLKTLFRSNGLPDLYQPQNILRNFRIIATMALLPTIPKSFLAW